MSWPINPNRFQSLEQPPEAFDKGAAYHFVWIGRQLLGRSERGRLQPLTGDDLRWLDLEISFEHYLGQYEDGRACFAVRASGEPGAELVAMDLRGWLGRVEPDLFYLAGRSAQITEWATSHRYCGRCGAETALHPLERALRCEACGVTMYPNLAPSIIVLVVRGEEMLLARNANWPTGMYGTLAGFVEPGESIEQTVHREVAEEVGLKVDNLRYQGSQSWPFPNSLMLGFHADYAGGDLELQEDEISDAQWFTANDLPTIPPKTAISRWLIDDFVAGLSG
ncbi:MAG: NAD(+) diphosphatase [Pseudomonadota bacterium]